MDYQRRKKRLERRVLKLARGIVLRNDDASAGFLLLRGGKVHLNRHAMTILTLCDGSRSREAVVVQAVLGSPLDTRPAEVAEFIDAALARCWLMEARSQGQRGAGASAR